MEDNDVLLQQKKRARRRLVGALAFVSFVAVVLPMVMEHEPRQAVPDVDIRIPGQDDKPFVPKFAVSPPEKPAVATVDRASPTAATAKVLPAETVSPPPARAADKPLEKPVDKAADKAVARLQDKPGEKPGDRLADKPAEKLPEKAATKPDDAKRAAAILQGQAGDNKPAAKSGEFLVLIGAFANEANVTIIKSKLGEMGIKVFSEPLDTPQGRKTRVRAGPFPNREAAEKALEKMQRVGVSGVIAAKQ